MQIKQAQEFTLWAIKFCFTSTNQQLLRSALSDLSAACWYLCQFVSEAAACFAFYCFAVEIHQQSSEDGSDRSQFLSLLSHLKAPARIPGLTLTVSPCPGRCADVPACITAGHSEMNYRPQRPNMFTDPETSSGWKSPVNSGWKSLRVWFNKDFVRSSCCSHESLKNNEKNRIHLLWAVKWKDVTVSGYEIKWWIKKATRLWACVAKQTNGRRDLFVSHQVETNWKGQRGGVFRDSEAFRVIPGVWQNVKTCSALRPEETKTKYRGKEINYCEEVKE